MKNSTIFHKDCSQHSFTVSTSSLITPDPFAVGSLWNCSDFFKHFGHFGDLSQTCATIHDKLLDCFPRRCRFADCNIGCASVVFKTPSKGTLHRGKRA